MADYQENQLLDARGLLCPMPIVKAGKVMRGMEDGEILKVLATDRGSIVDFPAWCEDTGNALLEWHEGDEGLVFFIRKVEEED